MTTLPPEGQDSQLAGDESIPAVPAADPVAQQPEQPPAAPEAPGAPEAPVPPAPPVPPQHTAPQPPPQYAAPQQPTAPPQAPQYSAPQQPSVQPPQYAAPPAAGAYQTPPPGGTQQPPLGYQQPVTDPVTNITLNYWLSVFFSWIPALIFFIVEKDKGNQQAYVYHRDNLNFSLLRVGVGIATWVLGAIPVLGWLFGTLLGIGSVVLFVFHIIAAAKAPEGFLRGEQPGFIFNIPLVK